MVGGWGGYVSLVRFILQFTKVFGGVSGANWQFFFGILSVLAISFICGV